MEKKIIAVTAILVIAFFAIVFVQPMLKPAPIEDIEQPGYVDPKVLEGSKLTEDAPFLEGQNFSGENCESNQNLGDRDYCFLVQADNSGSIESCVKISETAQKNICVKMLAVDRQNTAFCNYSESAFSPNDNSNVKYACILAVAEEVADEEICGQIPNAGWKQACVEAVQRQTQSV